MILCADVLEGLASLPGGLADCCVTSPPYWGLRSYGFDGQIGLESTPGEYVERLVSVFREVRRVLRDDATAWINLGDSYAAQCKGSGGTENSGLMRDGRPEGRRRITAAGSIDHQMLGAVRAFDLGVARLKPKDLVGIPWMVAFALRADGWWLRADIIWCLSGGARVYARTQKGDMPMAVKDLVRLDPATVKLWNGEKWTQALGWSRSPEPRDGALEVELRSGERIGCTPGHEWPTQRGVVRADGLLPGDVIQTCRLPEPDAPRSPAYVGAELAWAAGLYLAEGSHGGRGRLHFAGHTLQNESRAARLRPIVEAFGGTMAVRENGNSGTIIIDCPAVAAIIGQYIHGRSARTKGIKVRAWRHSNEWLSALLRGYLDGDGHYDEPNDRWRLGLTRNDRLAADLRTLAARLGCVLTLKATHGEGFGKRWATYRGELRMEPSAHWNAKDRGEVVSVGPGKSRQHWDIGVADEPHLFALASGVLTHNSKPNPMPESVTDRPTKAHEYLFLLAKSERYFYDGDAIAESASGRSSGRVAIDKAGIGEGFEIRSGFAKCGDAAWAERNRRTVWTLATQPYPGAHFATFPESLVEPCIRAGSREGGIVLDPFSGSGTTGRVARRLNRRFVLIDRKLEYCAMARRRTSMVQRELVAAEPASQPAAEAAS